VVVTNTESVPQVVAVVSPGGTGVSVSVSTTESASVTSTSVAHVTVTLVVPVVDGVALSVWVGETIWSPSEIVSTIDLGCVVLESIDITWLVVRVTPGNVVSVEVLLNWDSLSLRSSSSPSSFNSSNEANSYSDFLEHID